MFVTLNVTRCGFVLDNNNNGNNNNNNNTTTPQQPQNQNNDDDDDDDDKVRSRDQGEEGWGSRRRCRRVSIPRYVFFLFFFLTILIFDTNYTQAWPIPLPHTTPATRTTHESTTRGLAFIPLPKPPTSHNDSLVVFDSPPHMTQAPTTTNESLRLVGWLYAFSKTTNKS